MNKQRELFSFSPQINSVEEGESVLAVSSFEATNSVFNITDEVNSFLNTIPGHWQTKSDEKTIDELNKLLQLRSHEGSELHVKEIRKRKKSNKNRRQCI